MNRHYFLFKTGDHWHVPDSMAYALDPKWDVKIFAVTNDTYLKSDESVERFKQLFYEVATDRQGNPPTNVEQCFLALKNAGSSQGIVTPKPPSKLVKLMQENKDRGMLLHLPTTNVTSTAHDTFPATICHPTVSY